MNRDSRPVTRLCEEAIEEHWSHEGPKFAAGMKHDTDKPRMDLLLADMPRALIEVGKVLTFGAEKYSPGNWVYVENAEQRYRAAGLRHDLALSTGDQHDSETGLHHLAHEACCVLFRLELALREKEAGA